MKYGLRFILSTLVYDSDLFWIYSLNNAIFIDLIFDVDRESKAAAHAPRSRFDGSNISHSVNLCHLNMIRIEVQSLAVENGLLPENSHYINSYVYVKG